MTTVTSPPVVIPAIPPKPPVLSLLNSAIRPDAESDPRASAPSAEQLSSLPADLVAELREHGVAMWGRGIEYAPENQREARVRDPCDKTTVLSRLTNLPIVYAVPMVIIAEDSCATFGFEERDYKGRALRLLELSEHKAIEKEFWAGAQATAASWPNNFLMKSGAVTEVKPASVPSVKRGMQILQDTLAETGSGAQGMIHVQRQTATNLLNVRRVGNLLLDIFDNIVVPGVGYPGTGPGGKAPASGNAYIGASDLVSVLVEDEGTVYPDTFAEALDWGQTTAKEPNTLRFYAEKLAMAFFDAGRQFCIEVALET